MSYQFSDVSFQFTHYCLLDGYAVPLATLKKASPHTLHPTPYTLHPTPHTPHPTPYTPHPPAPPMSGGLGGSHPTPHTPHPNSLLGAIAKFC
ncbi:hypothetical protein M8120_05840 [Microcystis aeruginosa str. Chao 1910]|uniref:hypothetical protein n=1 Tax=Microcystis aeruginosa TaxID=1126 RepID=UPI0022457F27|nr:hypothetical protein [Microcystis aeruginosa]UZO77491.1 hypothetical protein M8120_05840 [Microcystis aeruginosa str. Chao 1910]